jgi:DNA-binding IclR family transcriptional regulator
MTNDGVAAVNRALDLLDAFSEGDDALSLTELSKRTGLYKSTALRLIQSLEKYGHLQRTLENTYRLGPKVLYLGSLYQRHFDPSRFIPQVLRRLAEEVNETASFYVREGDSRVCLHRHEAARKIRASVTQGERLSMTVGAAGHVILAFSGLSGDKYDTIRETGYAISIGERDPETAAVACPVLGLGGELAGVLNISGPRYRLEQKTLEDFVPVLFNHAATLSRMYGGVALKSGTD